MDTLKIVELIKNKFEKTGKITEISLLKGGSFSAELLPDGINVDNLGVQPFLPWIVFQEAVSVIIQNGGRALKGNPMGPKLGDPELPLDSIEGHIAHVVYGQQPGESVFRRITPISCILIWAGICRAAPNELLLVNME